MLRDLQIRNLAVVEDASIEFGPGLNVVSGATGAGKSIVVDSMALLAGGRARTDLIRAGADLLTVTGLFTAVDSPVLQVLDDAGIEVEGSEVAVRREVSRRGRNRIFVNDQQVTLRLLSDLSPFLLRIHTQREELGLVSPELQRFWLDRSGGSEARELLESVRTAYEKWADFDRRRQTLAGDERLRLERIDLLRFQRSEIDSAGLEGGEEDALTQRRDQLRHWEAIQRALGGSVTLLLDGEGAAGESVARSQKLLDEVVDWLPAAREWQTELEEVRIRLDEVSRGLRERLDEAPADPRELDEVESRLVLIDRLSRKYGTGTTEILEYRDRIARELEELEQSEEGREALDERVREALDAYSAVADRLSRARAVWGAALVELIQMELADLAMGRAVLEVGLERSRLEDSPLVVDGKPVEFSCEGIDRVTFVLQANPGEQKGPVARVASGGELSRIYLALQLAVGQLAAGQLAVGQSSAGQMEVGQSAGAARPTMIFDEVDAGIGGSEAAALGRKLRALSAAGQILAVTHLPQVASCGHQQFHVRKQVDDDRTRAVVESLSGDRRIEEIARMLSGESVTETSVSHARDLLASAEAGG